MDAEKFEVWGRTVVGLLVGVALWYGRGETAVVEGM